MHPLEKGYIQQDLAALRASKQRPTWRHQRSTGQYDARKHWRPL